VRIRKKEMMKKKRKHGRKEAINEN